MKNENVTFICLFGLSFFRTVGAVAFFKLSFFSFCGCWWFIYHTTVHHCSIFLHYLPLWSKAAVKLMRTKMSVVRFGHIFPNTTALYFLSKPDISRPWNCFGSFRSKGLCLLSQLHHCHVLDLLQSMQSKSFKCHTSLVFFRYLPCHTFLFVRIKPTNIQTCSYYPLNL